MKTTRFQEGSVDGFVHESSVAAKAGLVLTHGAGSNCESPLLVTLANDLCKEGLIVLRCNLPFRQKRPSGPPPPASGEDDRAGLLAAAESMRHMTNSPLILGGHSYGGRQATMLAAGQPFAAEYLLLLSYPLHPPAKPNQLRTAHFPNLHIPSLFVHGTKDPFGSIDEMATALNQVPAPNELLRVEGKGHDLGGARFNVEKVGLAQLKKFFKLL